VVWPQLLASLPNVRFIQAKFEDHLYQFPFKGFSWSSLPSSLVTLKLETDFSTFDFSSTPFGFDKTLPNLKTLELTYGYSEDTPNIDAPDFGSLCPRLERLKFRTIQPSDFGTCSLPLLKTSSLPRAITNLSWIGSEIELDRDRAFGGWPDGLENLSIEMRHTQGYEWLRSLPPGIRHFSLFGLTQDPINSIDWSLPNLPNIESLRLCILVGEFQARHAMQLPCFLKAFRWDGTFSERLIAALPRSVTSIRCSDDSYILRDPQQLAALPPGLTSIPFLRFHHSLFAEKIPFELKELGLEGPPRVGFLQSDVMTSLKIHNTLDWNEPLAWPRFLTELEIEYNGRSESNLHATPLPSGLTSLTLTGVHGLSVPQIWKNLPPGLRTLSHKPWRASTSVSDYHLLSDLSSQYLPRSLTSLTLFNVSAADDNWFSALPPSLLSMYLVSIANLTPEHLQPLRESRLRHLEISFTKILEGKLLPFVMVLPRLLHSLDLWSEESLETIDLTDSDLALFPRGLVNLTLPETDEKPIFTDACTAFLPVFLQEFQLGNDFLEYQSPDSPW
jgi:hypothetical protein